MNRKIQYVAGFILVVFVIALGACKQPTGSGNTAYTVTFDKNHQDVTGWTEANPRTMTVTEPATTVDNLPARPERRGWNFNGWNTARDGNGTPFDSSTPVTKNTNVYAQWNEIDLSDSLTVALHISGDTIGDSLTLSSSSGEAGDTVTITYTVAGSKINNRLVFSGTTPAIAAVNSAESGTRMYIINEDDAADGCITINAVFTHTDLQFDTIAFADDQNERKEYGDSPFTKAIITTGNGSGAISYSSDNTAVATVNATGTVTILSVGNAAITATKASDGIHEAAQAVYTVHVTALVLLISAPNVTTTKTYDGTPTANVVIGSLTNVVGDDTVNVTGSASYNSANVTEANLITVVYAIAGASASNYAKPDNATVNGTIIKATGATLSAVPTTSVVTHNRITVRAITPPANGLTVEYAISGTATPTPASGWQTGTDFTGLTPETDYYIHARVQGNENCNEGPAQVSAKITTPEYVPVVIPPVVVDFEADSVGKTYEFTRGGASPTVAVVADPVNSGQKSLRIAATGYNQAAIIPIHLPYALQNYQSFSFRIYIQSGTGLTGSVLVYAAGGASVFAQHGFGNPADSQYTQFAANLAGQTAAADFSTSTYANTWTPFTITLNPGSAISNLKGDIYIAIGINSDKSVTYLIDDLTFTIKSGFEPPVPIPAPQPPTIGAVASGNYRNMFEEMGKSEAEITAKVQDTWNKLFTGTGETNRIYYTVGSDMAYILDSGNNDVRSEGMSYGMMMAVQMNQKDVFDRLWKWARTYMYNPPDIKKDNIRGYFSWKRSTNGTGGDPNPAPDGEFYFITSLLFASARWGDGQGIYEYGKVARQILYDMIHRDPGGMDNWGAPSMFRTEAGTGQYMPVFSTIGQAANHTDPSYHLPAFYEVWAIELEKDANAGKTWGIWPSVQALRDDAAFYRNAVQASRSFFPKTTNATTGLGPDYANFDGTATGSQPYFEYDAWRIAMNIAVDYAWWAADSWQITFADRIQAFFHSKGVNSYKSLWQLDGTPRQNPGDHSPGLVAGNAAASLAATHERAWDFLENFWEISMTPGQYRYYDGCLYMLGLLHVTGNFKAYLSGNTVIISSSSISPETATFDKKAGAQADINVIMTLNGNDFARIQNGATTLTSGTHYIRSGDTVTLKKEYFAVQPDGETTLTFVFSAGSNRTLTVTIADTTPSTTISPTTATFDKNDPKDIPVTMDLYGGDTLQSIKNGSATLASGNYTVSGNTVTLKTSYLETLDNGSVSLTFVFSSGGNRTLTVTVKDSTVTVVTTKYDFSTDPGEVWSFGPAGSSTAVWGSSGTGANAGDGVSVTSVTRGGNNSHTGTFILPFDLGADKLSDYKTIEIKMRAVVDNNATNKTFKAEVVSSNSPTAFGYTGQNIEIATFGSNALAGQWQWNTRTGSITTTTATASLTGVVYIGFGIPEWQNVGTTYQIESIELKK